MHFITKNNKKTGEIAIILLTDANAVLKEQDLEKTLSVLRTELVERHQDLTSQASDLPQTSFRPSVAAGTLSLAVHLPLLGRARDLHPLDYAHVGRTIVKGSVRLNRSFFLCLYETI